MTEEKAFEILGLNRDELLSKDEIQEMLTQHAEQPSLKIESTIIGKDGQKKMITITNLKALFNKEWIVDNLFNELFPIYSASILLALL